MAVLHGGVLVMGNGAVGAEKQALALAAAMKLPVSEVARLLPNSAAMRCPLRLQLALQSVFGPSRLGISIPAPPYPLLAISCGRGSVAASVALRAASGYRTTTVHVQRPLCDESSFDLVAAPQHDYMGEPCPENVVLTQGSLHNVTAKTIEASRKYWQDYLLQLPHPRLAVFFGGPISRRPWQRQLTAGIDVAAAELLASSAVAAVSSAGGSLMVTTSRRTPAAVEAAIERVLFSAEARGLPLRLHTGSGANTYDAMIAGADYFLVTADSINMVSEACGSGRPVYVSAPEQSRGRFAHFYAEMLRNGRVRSWEKASGGLESASLWKARRSDDTQRVAAAVAQLLLRRRSAWSDIANAREITAILTQVTHAER